MKGEKCCAFVNWVWWGFFVRKFHFIVHNKFLRPWCRLPPFRHHWISPLMFVAEPGEGAGAWTRRPIAVMSRPGLGTAIILFNPKRCHPFHRSQELRRPWDFNNFLKLESCVGCECLNVLNVCSRRGGGVVKTFFSTHDIITPSSLSFFNRRKYREVFLCLLKSSWASTITTWFGNSMRDTVNPTPHAHTLLILSIICTY